jgi:NAD(P)-dependent dehydrogenase (short-subunit alcohol dehydrogenase family)
MSHVRAVRILLPDMIARGGGCLINVASAAGLLTQIGDAAYSASKAAAVSFAENLAIRHGDDGIAVHVVCPQYVASPMLGYDNAMPDDLPKNLPDGLIAPRDVADAVLQAMADGRVLVLPHAVVGPYFQTRATDHAKWIKGMQSLNRRAKTAQARSASDFSKLI